MNWHAWYGWGDWHNDKIVASAAAGFTCICETVKNTCVTMSMCDASLQIHMHAQTTCI